MIVIKNMQIAAIRVIAVSVAMIISFMFHKINFILWFYYSYNNRLVSKR